MDVNAHRFRHSSRKRPLNDSMCPFSVMSLDGGGKEEYSRMRRHWQLGGKCSEAPPKQPLPGANRGKTRPDRFSVVSRKNLYIGIPGSRAGCRHGNLELAVVAQRESRFQISLTARVRPE